MVGVDLKLYRKLRLVSGFFLGLGLIYFVGLVFLCVYYLIWHFRPTGVLGFVPLVVFRPSTTGM